MVRKKQADKTELITDILLKAEAALADVFAYYKFGRYEGTSWGQLYFLLSHCARLVFSLWLIDEDSGRTIFRGTPCPAALLTTLDFRSLRQVDNAGCILHPDSCQDPLKNEPRWFNAWMQILDGITYPGSPDSQESSRRVLIQAGHRTFLDGGMQRRDRRTIERAVKTDQVGHLLVCSMSVLKDAIQAMAYYLATLDSGTYLAEQVRALTCLLSQIRRTIVYETPATGPYVPSRAKGWAMPSLLSRLYFGRTRGVLKVLLRREGGGVMCTYDWTSDSGPNGRSWTCSLSALKGTYEESLFGTWAYETGECRHDRAGPSGERACWMVQSTEAGLLRSISRQVEALLGALRANPICSSLVEAVAGIVENNDVKGRRSVLPWTCVRQLDQVLEQLKSVCRAAAVDDEDNRVEQLIDEIWPVQHVEARWASRQLSNSFRAEIASKAGVRLDDGMSATAGQSAVHSSADAEPVGGSQPPPLDQAVTSSSLLMQKPPGERVSGDPAIQVSDTSMAMCPAAPDAHTQSKASEDVVPRQQQVDSAGEAGGHESRATIVVSEEDEEGQPVCTTDTPSGSFRTTVDNPLLRRLLEHHRRRPGKTECAPVSLIQLQRDLAWSRSKVQRAMADMFGCQPFSVYKKKCQDHTILVFLRKFAAEERNPSNAGDHKHCVKAPSES